ncbi:S6 family peptidase [Campylobacter jejuni]
MKKKSIVFLSFVLVLEAQNIDISKFYYRDYLDFGQNKGAFSGNGSTTIMGKDGTKVSVPNVPNFSTSSNNGNLTAVGRGFAVTANHVVSFTPEYDNTGVYRKFGLTSYKVSGDREGDNVSQPYGRDEKFTRFDKYIVEGQVSMLDIENSISQGNTETEQKNIQNFKTQLNDFAKDSDGNVYIYQTGSGVITLRNSYSSSTGISRDTNGETRGGGFGTLKQDSINYAKLVYCPSESCENTNVYGMYFTYVPNGDFNNRITTGDSGSGIYAFNQKTKQWVLLGVTSQSTTTNVAYIAAVSNKDLQDYKSKFEQKVDLKITEPNINEWTLTTNNLKYIKRGDTPDKSYTLEKNKDIIFSGNGTMTIQVQENIQLNQDKVGAGGFVFEKANTETTYKFRNANGGNYFFKGSGLDIGENVKVEWALKGVSGDSLHKIGKGELVITTQNTKNTGLGTLKIGEGKVTLDTTTKAFDNIYITSGRGELVLVNGKAQALGASKTTTNGVNSASSANSYTLAQDSTDKMGFYFGKGGGKFDLAGNSLVLNTIAANDSKAIITNSGNTAVNLEIEGLGYENNKKTDKKADTIIHASIGDNASTNGANLNLIYTGNKTPTNRHSSLSAKAQNDSTASLIFDGHINIKGELKAENGNIVLQGHPTTHATISETSIRDKIKNAESGTGKPMPDYMDLSKPSNLKQPDWDSRNFNITGGIDLKNATLTVGKAAHLKANINADSSSQINFGGRHFIDSKDGKNVIGSGFSYQQGVTSGYLNADETYKDSSYSGTITANGTTITSKFMNFAPNLELKNGAKLNATNLTLNTNSNLNLSGNSSAEVGNLIFKDFTNNNFASKFTLNDNSKFEVKKSLSFDKSTLNLDTLKTRNNITLPMAYNLYIFNDSNITATSASFQSAKISVQNGASFNAQNLNFAENSMLVLNDKATLTITDILTSKNLSVNASNQSTFTASTLTASGIVNLNADTNSNIKFSTLNLQNGNLQNISQNVAIEKLNLTQSTANLQNLNTNSLKSIDLKNSSNLHFNELNLNDFDKNGLNLTSDDSSKAYIKRLIYDASNARTNGTNTALQSNIVISEKFELKNVGHNLGQNTQGTQNTDDEKLQKDLFTLKFDKNLELGNGAKLDISFAKAVKKDNKDLLFNKDYTIFSANSLTSSNHLQVDFKNSNGTSFGETDFYIKGKLDKDKNAFSVQFVRENPRNFSELKPHIDPSYSPFLEILLQHNDFDKSVDKAVNLSDYSALQERLISLDKSFKDVANSSSNVLETLPLLQRHNINKRIQNQRFTGAKYAYNEERYNPLQKSDFIPALLYLDKMEKEERVWSNVSGGYFTKDESKMSLQSVSVGYDKKLLSNEFLFGVMASITQMQLSHSADEFKQNPQIYSLTFYSNALFGDDELQNELGFSFFNDKRHIGDEELSAGGVGTFFNSLYKFKLSFLPQNFKPLILANVNFNSLNAIDTPTYIQKSYKDLSFDVGLGFELDFEKENGFYNISFIAQQDIYHSKDEVLVSLAKSDKFIPYKSNDPSLSYQLRLMGLENFNNGMFLRYSLSGFIDTKAYKGVSADIQLGYKY